MATLKNRRKKSIAIVAAGLTLAGTVGAYAWWSATGSDVGDAQTGVSTAFTVTVGTRTGDPLTPGGTQVQTIPFTVAYTGDNGSKHLEAMSVRVAEADGTTWNDVAGCSAADFTVLITDDPSPATFVSGDSVGGEATITMINRAADQNACQDELVPLYFEAVTGP
jgi:hypothetical protein